MKVKNLIIVAVLIVLNGFFNLKYINLVVTLPEIVFVLYFLTKKNTKEALFWHTIFFITCYTDIFKKDFLFFYNLSNESFNYALMNFHGLRYSLIITLLIILVQNSQKKVSIAVKQTVFYKLYKFLLYCLVTGFLLGGAGLLVLGYDYVHFFSYGYYILFCFGFTWAYLNEYETSLKDDLYEMVPYIVTIAVIFNFICTLLGLRENLIVIGSSSIDAYCFILIPLILYQKKTIPIFFVVGLQLYLMSGNTSGKQIYSLFIMFFATLIISFSKKNRMLVGGGRQVKTWFIILLVIIGYPVIKQTLSSSAEDKESNFEWKMQSVESLTNFATGDANMNDVYNSPYIRLAEISNIIYEDIHNPIYLFLGRGFGGYYQDELHMFNGLDLSAGAFSVDQIRSGKFSSGHDSFVTVPMLNGFVGFFMLMSLIVTTCKRSSQNYLYLTSLMFLLMWFYFDILLGVIGVMLLYAAEHKVQKT